jgi:hypothetical protein
MEIQVAESCGKLASMAGFLTAACRFLGIACQNFHTHL